ncbi:hypothetical protein F5B22DRAFT_144702 [Xylaria bambusicola]|uniref:uncharacterized protein n=1 Tax=Xylaria bambusicola TaxID=326684 RepID=UPI00200796AB|nr:uncharacterized protein F5B22DRAFT_144702 [Xylaria bambusicola]KAI0517046.1 hypothetical protein F5B22DRAFT_144702 [Xylaria bambusicola]
MCMASLDHCLAEAQRCCFRNSSAVHILEYMKEGKCKWVKDEDLGAYIGATQSRDEQHSSADTHQTPGADVSVARCQLRLFFISATIGDDELHTHVDPTILKLLHEHAKLPAKFIIDLYQTEDWTVFPTTYNLSKAGEAPSRSSLQYGFWSWGDRATHSFVQVFIESNMTTYYFVNFNDGLKQFIETSLTDYRGSRIPPLCLDMWILSHLLNSYRKGLGAQRSILRKIEHHHGGSTVQSQVEELHALSRRWHSMLKDFRDLKEHTRQLRAFLKRWDAVYNRSRPNHRRESSETIESILQFDNDCKFWASWARTYLERTNICINLAHHLENKELTTQARRESIAMFTLAIVTVIFLPSTFVASILGTNFFNFDGTLFTVSRFWWIIPVTSVPLTLFVLLFWYKWSKSRSEKTVVPIGDGLPEHKVWALPSFTKQQKA